MTQNSQHPPVHAHDLPEGFELPDWDAPFDPQLYFDIVPLDATAKGMFLQALADEAERLGKTFELPRRYYAFHNYPLQECMELTLEAAKLIHPDASLREALRRLGRLSYRTFADSMIGRAVFGIAGGDVGRILSLASKGASVASTVGKIEVASQGESSATLRVSEIYVFAECFNVGIAEGVLEVCGREGYVAQRMTSLTEGEFLVRWSG
jgi:uncharacterized protein (TIGR02265 family)